MFRCFNGEMDIAHLTQLLLAIFIVWDLKTVAAGRLKSRKREKWYGCRELFISIQKDKLIFINDIRAIPTEDNGLSLCEIGIKSKNGLLVKATVNYLPADNKTNCDNEFMIFGNGENRKNFEAMTSYRFCDETFEQEIISKGDYLWLIHGFRNQSKARTLQVAVDLEPGVVCNSTDFTCSPLQCVHWSRVCDGIKDCTNGRDEYCVSDGATTTDQPCFRCKNGTCIRPELSRYSDDWGKPLWYLCDGVKHCKDGTDERSDICMLLKGKREEVIECHPVSNRQQNQLMWRKGVQCNGQQDCVSNEDEAHCKETDIDAESVAVTPIIIVVTGVSIVALGSIFITHKLRAMDVSDLRSDKELRKRISSTSCPSTQDSDSAYESARKLRWAGHVYSDTENTRTSYSDSSSHKLRVSVGSIGGQSTSGVYSLEAPTSGSPLSERGAAVESSRRFRFSVSSAGKSSLGPVREEREELECFLSSV